MLELRYKKIAQELNITDRQVSDTAAMIAEGVNEDATARAKMREFFWGKGVIVSKVLPDVGILFTEPGKFFGIVTAAVDSTAQKALAAGISIAQADAQVSESSVVTAVQAAIHNRLAAKSGA